MTLRDDAWDRILTVLVNRGKFKLSELGFDNSQIHTVRRVCRTMRKKDWLIKESDQAAIWRAGPKAELLLDIDDDVLEASRM